MLAWVRVAGSHASAPQTQDKACSLVRAIPYSFISFLACLVQHTRVNHSLSQTKSKAIESRQQTFRPHTGKASEPLGRNACSEKSRKIPIAGRAGRSPMALRICLVSAHKAARSTDNGYAICQSLRKKREVRPAESQQAWNYGYLQQKI